MPPAPRLSTGMADLFGPPPLDQWPEPLQFLYEERWAIRWEAGMDEEAAKAAALVEVWERGTE